MKKHLVVGASGQVGSALANELSARGYTVLGTYLTHPRPGYIYLDMQEKDLLAGVIGDAAPDVIWVPGAMPEVDRCEREPELSHAVNVQGPCVLMEAAARWGIPLVYFSSDYVFDGVGGPYAESAATRPIQVYGQHKAEAEEILSQYDNALIVRTAWIYSEEPNPRNFVFRVLSQLRQNIPIKAAEDQYNTPTPASALARHAIDAWQAGYRGILHLAGPERMARTTLVSRIAHLLGYDSPVIESVRLGDLSLPARRPANGGLVTEVPQFAIMERLESLDVRQILT